MSWLCFPLFILVCKNYLSCPISYLICSVGRAVITVSVVWPNSCHGAMSSLYSSNQNLRILLNCFLTLWSSKLESYFTSTHLNSLRLKHALKKMFLSRKKTPTFLLCRYKGHSGLALMQRGGKQQKNVSENCECLCVYTTDLQSRTLNQILLNYKWLIFTQTAQIRRKTYKTIKT